MVSQIHKDIIHRCQQSCIYFFRNFTKTKHPSAGVIPFNPWGYQVNSVKAFRQHRFSIFKKVRQSGISTLAGKFSLWYSMFFNHRKTLVVSRSDDTAMEFLKENVTFTFDNLPDWMQKLWEPIKKNEHELVFPNGSSITSLTSHPDVLRSHASSLNIIDEAAFIQDMPVMWAGGYPTLIHGGCVVPDTLVLSSAGHVPIGSFLRGQENGWSTTTGDVLLEAGSRPVPLSYHNGIVETRNITTSDGYSIEGSLKHKLLRLTDSGVEWVEAVDLKVGDELVLSAAPLELGGDVPLSQDIFNQFSRGCRCCGEEIDEIKLRRVSKHNEGLCASCVTTARMISGQPLPAELTPKLCEIIGLLVGDGWYQLRGLFGISCDKQDVDTIAHIHRLVLELFGVEAFDEQHNGDYSVRWCSRGLALLFRKNGINKANSQSAEIPELVLRANNECRAAFLRGLFEADGSVSGGIVSLSSTSHRLICQTQQLLAALGMRSHQGGDEERHGAFGCNTLYRLNLKTRVDATLFREKIGFISSRKRSALGAVNSERSHRDRYYSCISGFYRACVAAGVPRRTKLNVYQAARRGQISRRTVKQLSLEYPVLGETALGALALADRFTDKIKSIEPSMSSTCDIHVPPEHYYIANSFISHNTVVVISTTNGVGSWYWNTWSDAESGLNNFHPISVDWWDMDWTISYTDALSGEQRSICPTAGIRKCETADEIQKWGPYWSPWLAEQYKGLQEKGEAWKFDQEILGRFVGSGRTIVSQVVLQFHETKLDDNFTKFQNEQAYVHPSTGEGKKINLNVGEQHSFAPGDGLWVWKPPVRGKPPVVRAGRIIEPGVAGHKYIAGIDLMTGRGADYHAMEIFDINTQEQAAEIMIHALPMEFQLIVDYLGRWYNNALLVIERNNGGDAFIDDMRLRLMYPNLWRKKTPQDKPTKSDGVKIRISEYGFSTGGASKEQLNQRLIDYLRADSGTVHFYSRRLYKQLQIYVRLKDRAGRDTGKTGAEDGPGNHDDLVIASGLAFIGWPDAIQADDGGLTPFQEAMRQEELKPPGSIEQLLDRCASIGGPNFVLPMPGTATSLGPMSIMEELERFTNQIGGLPVSQNLPMISQRPTDPFRR